MKDGIIEIGSPFGKQIGFTSDRFQPSCFLWLLDPYIWISLIEAKHPGKGHLAHLFRKIIHYGYGIKVPSPSIRMREICSKNGFTHTVESTDMGKCEVWVLAPKAGEHDTD